jgi:hypothetical protein
MFIKLNHHDTLALIEMLETQLEPLSEQETKTLKKLRLIYEAQKLSKKEIETNIEDKESS